MSIALGIALIALPLAFNLFFALLGVRFDYPGILREPTATVLEKFRAGGSALVSLWWGFALTALLFAPVSILLSLALRGADATLQVIAAAVGVLAALVQGLGLLRWPFLVPYLAREADGASAARAEAIDVVFQSFHRFLGVAVGEHLGYLFTGGWSVLIGVGILQSTVLPGWLGVAGIAIGAVLAVCSLEFVGPFERDGWHLAGSVVPVAYIAWSAWLVVLGVVVLVS